MKTITIDRSRPLVEQPKTGHNRWHPNIPAIIEVNEGEELALETRDAQTEAALDPILFEHRDMMYAEYLELPLSL